MKLCDIILTLYTSSLIQYCWADVKDTIVQTEYGKVRGTVRYATGPSRPVYSYFGVQYGRSPDYVFRFRPAEDPWTWEDVRDATDENRPLCVQDRERYDGLRKFTHLKYIMPEDPPMKENCLVLDIFTSKSANSTKKTEDLLPVVVWIHGGSFEAFASSTKLWALSAFEDVVLVQIQYRLGLFGFFTTENEWAPPNNAFHDHLKAMNWIQRNIKAFGGNPNLVTLMGESAGAVAATAHTLMPSSKGLFHSVFAISGAPNTMVWKSTYGDSVQRIARKMNCLFECSSATSTCLRNKITTSRLMNVAKDMNINFKLLEDRTLFPGDIRDLIESKAFVSSVPVMIGVMNGEQDYLLPRRVFSDVYFKGANVTRGEVERTVRGFLTERYPGQDIDYIAKVVIQEYMNPDKVGDGGIELFRGFLEAIGDCWFVSKSARFAEKVKDSGQRAYFFEFTAKPSMYEARREDFPRPHNFTSADHADDLLFAFGFPFVPGLADTGHPSLYFTDAERQLSKKYMRVIAHFARTGSPPSEIDWPQYPGYVEIGKGILVKREEFNAKRMRLWNEVVPGIA